MKKNTELQLSIVVPVYNAERYLEECLRSLFVQDLPMDTYEVIAVDNGSRDTSAAIIERLKSEYPNLRRVTLEQNQLPSGARNAGMDAAQGKYLMFVDSDDYLYSNVLQSLIHVMDSEDLDFAHFDTDMVLENNIIKGQYSESTSIITGITLWNLNLARRVVSWSKIYKRVFIEKYKLRCTEGLLYEDDEFAYRVYSLANRTRHIQIVPYIYREHQNSAMKRRVSFATLSSNLIELCAMYANLYGANPVVTDKIMVNEVEQIIRSNIREVYDIYRTLNKEEQRKAKTLMRETLTYQMCKYMSRKRYLLLKLGIIR